MTTSQRKATTVPNTPDQTDPGFLCRYRPDYVSNQLTLLCDECREPITHEEPGWIKIEPGIVGERRDSLAAWYRRNPGPHRFLSADAQDSYPHMARWWVVHRDCDRWPDSRSHGFSTRRAATERDLLYLAAHISSKRWSAHTDLSSLIRKILAAQPRPADSNGDTDA